MPNFPFQRAKPLGWSLFEVLTSAQMSQVDQNAAQAADGLLWTDAALLKNVLSSTIANRLGPLIYVPKDLLGIGSFTFMSFGINGANPEGSYCVEGRNAWSPLGSLQNGVGLQPLSAGCSPDGSTILVGGLPGSASTNKIRRSIDAGFNWTVQNVAAAGGNLASVRTLDWFPAASLWIAGFDADSLGAGGHLETSPDGVTWTARTTPNTNNHWRAAVSQAGVSAAAIVIIGSNSTNKAIRSTDGINWTEVTLPSTGVWTSIAWSARNGRFLAVRAGNAAWSTDGITWSNSLVTMPSQLTTITQVISIGRLWLVVGSTGSNSAVYYSGDNAASWQCAHVVLSTTTQTAPTIAASGNQIAWKDSAMGHHTSMRYGF